MIRATLLLAALGLGLLLRPAGAHGPDQPPHRMAKLGDFRLESGR